eukprot:639874-Pleurochrysis_carterae.AAC.1
MMCAASASFKYASTSNNTAHNGIISLVRRQSRRAGQSVIPREVTLHHTDRCVNLNDVQNSPSTTRTGELKLHCNDMCAGSYPDCGT